MSDDKITPGGEESQPGETDVIQDHGTNSENSTTGSEGNEGSESVEEGKAPNTISREEYEKVQKELQKLEMERNQLRNKQEEDRKKALEEQGNWKQIAEENQAKLEQIELEREQANAVKEASALRESFIDAYPDETVKKAAKALIERNPSNLSWGDVETEDQAKENIFSQLDALKETLGIISEAKDDEDFSPEILANNPSTNTNTDPVETLSWEKMRELLPKADPR